MRHAKLFFPPLNTTRIQQSDRPTLWATVPSSVQQEVVQALTAMLIDALLVRTAEESDD